MVRGRKMTITAPTTFWIWTYHLKDHIFDIVKLTPLKIMFLNNYVVVYCFPRMSCDYLCWSCDIRRTKQDLNFKLKVTVTIHDLTAIPSNENRPLFCVFEVCTFLMVCWFLLGPNWSIFWKEWANNYYKWVLFLNHACFQLYTVTLMVHNLSCERPIYTFVLQLKSTKLFINWHSLQ